VSEGTDSIGDILWRPNLERIAETALACFAGAAGFEPTGYAGLLDWSIRDPAAYHARLWEFLDIIGDRGEAVFEPGHDLLSTRFFPDARLNYAENLLRKPDDRLAIIAHRDDGTRRTVTRRELYDLVSRAAQALAASGISRGDRVRRSSPTTSKRSPCTWPPQRSAPSGRAARPISGRAGPATG
jgi:acetoacetyl-CoA synthetase